jgi:tryptophanyl-tRNA synthetase
VAINRFLDPMRERRARFGSSPGLVDDLIVTGTRRTRRQVRQTIAAMRGAMGLTAAYSQLRDGARRAGGADGI